MNKAKDILAEKPFFYSPSVIADQNAAKAPTPVHHAQGIRMISSNENETPDATPDSGPMVAASCSGIDAEDSTHGVATLSGIDQVRKHSARSQEPTEKPEVAFEDLRML